MTRIDRMYDKNDEDNYLYLFEHLYTEETEDQLSEWFSTSEIDIIILERERQRLLKKLSSRSNGVANNEFDLTT